LILTLESFSIDGRINQIMVMILLVMMVVVVVVVIRSGVGSHLW